MKTRLKPGQSALFVQPIEQDEKVVKGKIHSLGKTAESIYALEQVVYYNIDDIRSTHLIPTKIHSVFYYKISAIEETPVRAPHVFSGLEFGGGEDETS